MVSVGNASFLEALEETHLLGRAQLDELQQLEKRFSDSKEIARILMERDWLTPYQVNQIMQGRGRYLKLGSFILLERLGEGGMGQVFKAKWGITGEIVALKVLRARLLNNEIAVRRFEREIRAISQLNHPNIVRDLDGGVADGQHYCAMEFIDGIDLSRMIKEQGPLNVRQACEYVRQAAMGLRHANDRGMVHRDIKPANLLVQRDPKSAQLFKDDYNRRQAEKWGTVKLLDMGLARIISQDEEAASTLLTQINVVMGTPDFISPEQALNSHDCDVRSDLYSLGCTLYFLLTGKPPFPNGSVTEKLLQHRMDKPEAVEEVRRQQLIARGADAGELKYLSSKVGKLVRKLMNKKPEKRLQTPGELIEALTAILEPGPNAVSSSAVTLKSRNGKPKPNTLRRSNGILVEEAAELVLKNGAAKPKSSKPQTKRFRRLFWAAVLFFTIGMGFFALLAVISQTKKRNATPPKEQSPISKTKPKQTPESTSAWKKLKSRLAKPAVNIPQLWDDLLDFRVTYGASPESQKLRQLFLKLPSPLDSLDRNDSAVVRRRLWLKADEFVSVVRHSNSGGSYRALTVAFSPSAQFLATGLERSGVAIWDSAEMPKVKAPLRNFEASVNQLAFSQDGRRFAAGSLEGKIAVWDRTSKTPNVIQDDFAPSIVGLAFVPHVPHREKLISIDNRGEILLWDLFGKKAPKQLASPGKDNEFHTAVVSPNGKIIAMSRKDSRVVFAPRPRAGVEKHSIFVDMSGDLTTMDFAADDKTVLGGDSQGAVFVFKKAGDEFALKKRFKAHDGAIHDVAFSPDLEHFATIGEDKKLHLWHVEQVVPVKTWEFPFLPLSSVAFAPDGRHIAVARVDGTVFLLRLREAPQLANS